MAESAPWLHGPIKKDEAEQLLLAGEQDPKGRWLVRAFKPAATGNKRYVLSIMFKGKPTHHQMALSDDGKWGINGGKSYNTDTASIVVFVENLMTKPEGWPVQMKAFVPAAGAQQARADPAPPKRPPKAGSNKSKKGGIYVSTSHPWLYGTDVNKDAAEGLLSALGNKDGQFLVRGHKDASKLVLSVVYKGTATHHLCMLGDSSIQMNGKHFGTATNIAELVELLSSEKVPMWPVMLTDYPPSGDQGPEPEPEPEPVPAAVETSTETGRPWYHPGLNKGKAEELLASVGNDDGTFLVRSHKDPAKAVLSVIYRGKPTHHMMATTENSVTVNNKTYGTATTIEELIRTLMAGAVPGWPMQLGDYPPGPDDAGELVDTLPPVDGGAGGYIDLQVQNEAEGYIDITAEAEDPPDEPVEPADVVGTLARRLSMSSITLGLSSAVASLVEAAPTSTVAATYVPLGVAFTFTVQKPAQGGYGLSILNNGQGNFIVSAREGSVGQQALADAGHAVEAGLRIAKVNGTDVIMAPKPDCIALMKEADAIEIAVALDPTNYRISIDIREGRIPLPQAAAGADVLAAVHERSKPFANMTQLFMRDMFAGLSEPGDSDNGARVFTVPPELEDSKNGAFDWGADTAFSPIVLEAPVLADPTSLLDSRVPGYVGLLEQADCRQLLTSTLGGSYVIRELSPAVGGGYEVVVKHVSDDVVGLRIVARPDGRLEYKQRLYYRLKDVMFEISRRPIEISTARRGQAKLMLGAPDPGAVQRGRNLPPPVDHVGLTQDEADLMSQMTINPVMGR